VLLIRFQSQRGKTVVTERGASNYSLLYHPLYSLRLLKIIYTIDNSCTCYHNDQMSTTKAVATKCSSVRGDKVTSALHQSYSSYKLIVAYDGTRFHGFQRQIDNSTMMDRYKDKKQYASLRPKKRPHYHEVHNHQYDSTSTASTATVENIRKGCNISVQEVLEFVLLDLFHPTTPAMTVQEICLKFAGRTDKGVHANGQVCLVQLPLPPSINDHHPVHDTDLMNTDTTTDHQTGTNTAHYEYHCWKLRNDINSRLPIDVSVQHISHLIHDANTFDPRRDVTMKKYTYTVRYRRKLQDVVLPDQSNSINESSKNHIQSIIEQSGGPHSIRTARDSYCLWIVPWSICDSTLSQLCHHFMGPPKDFYFFIHKADRDNPKKTTRHTIQEMSYRIVNVSTESISIPLASLPSPLQTTTTTPIIQITSEIVTGEFTFIAKGFRRTMIRNIVGYCIDRCRNVPNIPAIGSVLLPHVECNDLDNNITQIDMIEKNQQRFPYIINAAPASGLCLEWVTY
jgi:tRNA pseudouridine(38-40) synthase